MITENRAVQLDLAARAVFARDGERITETRDLIEAICDSREPDRRDDLHTAVSLAGAAEGGLVEMG